MAGLGTRCLLLLTLAVFIPSGTATELCTQSCWEGCFQKLNQENQEYQQVWDDVLEIALEITALKNIYNVTRVGWLLDVALNDKYSALENPNTEQLENGHNIFHFEILLLMALTLIVNGQYNYIVEYDEESAWACDQQSCMDQTACQTVAAIQYLSIVELNPTSFCPGAVEAACKMLNNQINDVTPCAAENSNSMVVAIANKEFNINDPFRKQHHRSSSSSGSEEDFKICPPFKWGGLNSDSSSSSSSEEEDYFSPCHSYFNTRYVVGTHSAPRENMELFPSKHGNYRYIHDEEFSLYALNQLVWCMTQAPADGGCCSAVTEVPVTTCWKTQGPYGELINAYQTHPAINAAAVIIPVPTDPAVPANVMINMQG